MSPSRAASVSELLKRLRAAGQRLAVAESCTGGDVLSLLTAPAGASDCVWGGAVVYTADAKASLAGLARGWVLKQGVVSAAVTEALALGIRERSGVELGAAVTGWAGPTSKGPDPVGTVYLAVAGPYGCCCRRKQLHGDRAAVRAAAAGALLELLLERAGETVAGDGEE